MLYKEHFPYRLEHIKQLCSENMVEIALCPAGFISMHEGEPVSDICVRYVIDEGKFSYAYMGDFFFVDDCMYVISDDKQYEDDHNDSIPLLVKDLYGVDWGRHGEFVFRVIFAGVRTPFKDNAGDWIYTGDIVRANDYLISGICAFPPFSGEECISPANYGVMLDNHMLPLKECNSIERLGTVFFCIDKQETEISIENQIGGRAQYGGFNEDELYCAKYTPSYYQEMWKYKSLEIIGAEYNWRK